MRRKVRTARALTPRFCALALPQSFTLELNPEIVIEEWAGDTLGGVANETAYSVLRGSIMCARALPLSVCFSRARLSVSLTLSRGSGVGALDRGCKLPLSWFNTARCGCPRLRYSMSLDANYTVYAHHFGSGDEASNDYYLESSDTWNVALDARPAPKPAARTPNAVGSARASLSLRQEHLRAAS